MMSTSTTMNPQSNCPKSEEPTSTPSGPPLKSFFTKRDQGKVYENVNHTISKIKRRKTKKERNCLKFKSHKETYQKKRWPPGILRHRHDGFSNLNSVKMTLQSSNFKQVFITQNRLTQHLGIFNREVKSVDIERFVRESTEVEEAKKSVVIIATTPQSQKSLMLGLIPTPEKNLEEISSPIQTPVQMVTEGPQSAPESLTCSENENLEPHANQELCKNPEFCIQYKEDHPQIMLSGGKTGSSPDNVQDVPVHQVAESITNMLNVLTVFPGRNLVKETRQSILEMKSQLCGAGSNLLVLPLRTELDYDQKAGSPPPTTSKWGHSGEERRGVVETSGRSQGPAQEIQTPASHLMSVPRGSRIHTLIKKVSAEERERKLSPVFHHPVQCGADYKVSVKRYQLSAESPPHRLNLSSSRKGPGPSQQDNHTVTFHGANRHSEKPRLSGQADRNQIRWRFTTDDLLYKHDVLQENVSAMASLRMPERGTPLAISPEPSNSSWPKARSTSARQKTTSAVLQNICERNPPTTQISGPSLTHCRTCRPALKSPSSSSKTYLESHQNICREDLACRHRSDEPLSLRNVKQLLSSPLEPDMVPRQDDVPFRYMPRWRNTYESSNRTIRNSPSSLREATMYRGSGEKNSNAQWQSTINWSLNTPHQNHQWRPRSMSTPSWSVEQENPCFRLPFVRSVSKGLPERPSPDGWRYPRMKLY